MQVNATSADFAGNLTASPDGSAITSKLALSYSTSNNSSYAPLAEITSVPLTTPISAQGHEPLRQRPTTVNYQWPICYDNALAESFFAALKNGRVHRTAYPTPRKAQEDIARYIELFYNRTRLHSGIGYRTPQEVRAEQLSRQLAA